MRFIILAISVTASCVSAFAVDYRWFDEVNRGTVSAIVRNGNGSKLDIYCASADDGRAGFSLETKLIMTSSEPLDVQIVIDGKSHPFTLTNMVYEASGRLPFSALNALADDLIASRKPSFIVEYPKYKRSETFSLLGARQLLGVSSKSILSGCDPR